MNEIVYDNNLLNIDGKEVAFQEDIEQVEIENDRIYILLDIKPKDVLPFDDFHNVYCYSTDGKRVWQIGIRPKGDETVYTMIHLHEEFLYANDFLGRRYSVDKFSGEIKGMSIAK